MRSSRLLIILGVVALLVAGAAWALAARRNAQDSVSNDAATAPEQETDGLRAQRTKGDPDAPITVYEISDFQCPYCRTFWQETLPQLDREYIQTGKVRFVFLNLPLVSLHPNAPAAHEFAMCAARQDRFWPVHDLLFEHQSAWANLSEPATFFTSLRDSAALDESAMTECLETGAMRSLIQQEAVALSQAGVTGTPSFVIEGGLMPNVPFDMWRPVLDSIFTARTEGGR